MATENYRFTHDSTNFALHTNDVPLEKDFSQDKHLPPHIGSEEALRRFRSAGSISTSAELAEKSYLSQNKGHEDLRKTFGNPTPLALCGVLISLSPLSCDLMGWRGAGGNGAAGTGSYFFFGGLLMIMGGIGEWILGNTFPFVVFSSYGAFWLQFGATLQPFYNAYGAYSTTGNPADGLTSAGFHASYGFFFLAMALLSFVYLICSLRTNVVFFLIFFTLSSAFCLLAGAYWQLANGNAAFAGRLQFAAGAFTFTTCACGWWIFVSIMLATLDFPVRVPVGDLSRLIKGHSERLAQNHMNV